MPETAFAPCKNCGRDFIVYETDATSDPDPDVLLSYVRCFNCSTRTASMQTDDEAAAAWNRGDVKPCP